MMKTCIITSNVRHSTCDAWKQPLAQGGYPVEIKVNNNNSERGSVISVCHVLGVQWFVECRYIETHHDESRREVD